MTLPLTFEASVISGRGRGRRLKIPTINIDLPDVPSAVTKGIYAATVLLGGETIPAAIHYGPRPFFGDDRTFEVHVIEREVSEPPNSIQITLVEYLREVRNFESEEALKEQIQRDIDACKRILL